MKNLIKFKEFITGLGELFDKDITETLSDIYWKALEPFPYKQCEIAFNKCFVECKFFPKPADLIEFINNNGRKSGEVAWGEVMSALELGNESSLDRASKTAIQSLGGWSYLSSLSYDDLYWQGKKFSEIYEYYADSEELEEIPLLKQGKNEKPIEISDDKMKELLPIANSMRKNGKIDNEIQEYVRNHMKKQQESEFESIGEILKQAG